MVNAVQFARQLENINHMKIEKETNLYIQLEFDILNIFL